jgi:preprotein translocase subunit SecD
LLKAVLGDKYSIAPNIAPKTPQWLRDIGAQQMRKGLDLQGGIHFLLAVDTNALVKQRQSSDMRSIGATLRDEQVRYTGLMAAGTQTIQLTFKTDQAAQSALPLLNRDFSSYHWVTQESSQPITIKGQLTQQALQDMQKYAVNQNMAILRNRVNELGVSEPVVVQQGANYISVDLPGIQDSARAKEMIGKVATIRMQMVDYQHDAAQAAQSGEIPFGDKLYKEQNGAPILLKNRIVLKGTSIVSAQAQIGENGKPVVSIRLSGPEVSRFNRITAANIGKPMATVYVETKMENRLVNGKVVTTPKQVETVINVATINSALGNSFQIMNLESQTYSRNLALLLRSGAYTAPVDFVQERLVGPTLGKENIKKGKISTFVGTLLVVLFMALYYRTFGLIADIALILNLIFIVAVLSIIGATLTLPGIAAIVLTLGMAVDANVLINERIREELRLGMSPQAAIAAGYGRAFMTIVDANVTTLIVAVVLVTISSSSVKGFAVNLIIGLVTSMITAIFVTRAVVNLVYGRKQNLKKISIGI